VAAILAFAAGSQTPADVVILSDFPGSDKPLISGETGQADQPFSPASTFKMIIALVALEKKIATPTTTILCSDSYLPQKPMQLDFQKAMYHSSNDFFVALLDKITPDELLAMAAKCGFGKPTGPPPSDKSAWRHGGNIRVTPREEHRFLRKLAAGQLPVAPGVQADLIRVMRWPSPKDQWQIFGKTGSWERTYWFVGMVHKSEGPARIGTVTLTSHGSDREKAIQRFLQQIERPIEP
jgi:beta-lactamase class D